VTDASSGKTIQTIPQHQDKITAIACANKIVATSSMVISFLLHVSFSVVHFHLVFFSGLHCMHLASSYEEESMDVG
jgi:hypothetical protein